VLCLREQEGKMRVTVKIPNIAKTKVTKDHVIDSIKEKDKRINKCLLIKIVNPVSIAFYF
jgi:hypothetical protein